MIRQSLLHCVDLLNVSVFSVFDALESGYILRNRSEDLAGEGSYILIKL